MAASFSAEQGSFGLQNRAGSVDGVDEGKHACGGERSELRVGVAGLEWQLAG